ncbi:tyrosine-type recombinase/integrase [Acinetobacter sp. YH12238]|uniref:tyrosine-type recombinase/integrase n=1 Tax=Acinetobacter sp. YH12238 TaxID=2601165 RepID=UPI0015D3C79D|nr:tyrosine-type recombinase/integrase [Acinetobacter sp. YH12238]
MLKQKHYAHERRTKNRDQKRIKEHLQIQAIIDEFLSQEKLQQTQQSQNFPDLYNQVIQHLEQQKVSFSLKKAFYQHFRKHIIQYNRANDADLPLPTQHLVSIKRTPLIFNESWLENSKYLTYLKERLWRYWHTTEHFSDDEIVGNLLISAILYGGLSHQASLNALLEHLKTDEEIYYVQALQFPLLLLEPQSPHYGDLYDPKHPLKKSRNFVPDRLTQLWILRFKAKPIDIQFDCYAYIRSIFNALEIPFNQKQFNQLLEASSHSLMQLDNVNLSPALTLCLSEEIETCGLSPSAFKRYLSPQLILCHSEQTKEPLFKNINSTAKEERLHTEDTLEALTALHKQILRFFKNSHKTSTDLYNVLHSQHNSLPENGKRLALWLYSLFHPALEDIKSIAQLYQLDSAKYLHHISQQQKIRYSSIYSYYTKLAETWLLHSNDFIEEPNLNDHLDVIYKRMLNGIGKSKSQKFALLKRFHQFQQMLFNAESFPLQTEGQDFSSPKAEIISAKTFQQMLIQLKGYQSPRYTVHDLEMLSIVYTIAFRTGMRINEILGLRIKDVEGVQASSIWIRPYRAKHQQHLLKTDSAERNLNVQILLTQEEHLKFQHYCQVRRRAYRPSQYLFTMWNSTERLKPNMVTLPFQRILDAILPGHRYSFHSLRHTAANNLAIILTMDYEFVVAFTDYSNDHYNLIRSHLLRSNAPQDSWYLIAHLLGHIEPNETFRSYIHLSYVMAGFQLRQFDLMLSTQIIQKICPTLITPLKHAQEIHLSSFDTQMLQATHVIPLGIDKQSSMPINKKEIQQKPTDDCIYGTARSEYPSALIIKILKALDQSYTPELLAQKYDFPIKTLMLWQQNILKLKQLKNRKNRPRFIIDADKSQRILPHIETMEEKIVLEYFFKQLNQHSYNDIHILNALAIFEMKANISHAGLIFNSAEVRLANRFLTGIYSLFPAKYWQIALPLKISQDKLTEKLHIKSIPYRMNGSLSNAFKLELVSQNNGKALTVLRYCMLVLLILCTPSQPRS